MIISQGLREKISECAPRYYKEFGSIQDKTEIVQEIGFECLSEDLITNGSGRSIFDMKSLGYQNYCLKIATPNNNQYDGLTQNRCEISVWESADKQEKEYLCPVVDCGSENYWLIMKKGNSEVDANILWYERAKYVLSGLVLEDDIRRENIVRLDGEFVLCDYGVPCQSSHE